MKTWEPINKGICTIKESNAEDIINLEMIEIFAANVLEKLN